MATTTTDGNYSVEVPQTNNAADIDRFGTLINAILHGLPAWFRTRIDDMNFADFVLSRPKLKDYGETAQSVSSSSNVLTIDIEDGNHAYTTLTENVTTLTINNPTATGFVCPILLFVTQDGTGGRTITWPASFKWAGGSAPTVTSTASATDIYSAFTRDGGTTWYANIVGQNFQ